MTKDIKKRVTNEKNKKGMSGVIIILLIAIIGIVAVGLFYTVFKNVIVESKDVAEASSLSTVTSFAIEGIQDNPEDKTLSINVKRNAGGADAEIVAFIVSLESSDGQIKTFRKELSLSELESRSIEVSYENLGINDISSVAITPVFLINGKERVGTVSAERQLAERIRVPNAGGGTGGGGGGGGDGGDGGGDGGTGDGGGGQKEYCVDGDAEIEIDESEKTREATLEEQSRTLSLIIYLIDSCEANAENKEDCMYMVSAADVCLNNTALAEQTCNKDAHEIKEIQCENGCLHGKCLENAE